MLELQDRQDMVRALRRKMATMHLQNICRSTTLIGWETKERSDSQCWEPSKALSCARYGKLCWSTNPRPAQSSILVQSGINPALIGSLWQEKCDVGDKQVRTTRGNTGEKTKRIWSLGGSFNWTFLLHRVHDGGQANQKDARQMTKKFYKNISCCCTFKNCDVATQKLDYTGPVC